MVLDFSSTLYAIYHRRGLVVVFGAGRIYRGCDPRTDGNCRHMVTKCVSLLTSMKPRCAHAHSIAPSPRLVKCY